MPSLMSTLCLLRLQIRVIDCIVLFIRIIADEEILQLNLFSYLSLGICREHGKAYAVYLITVAKTNADGSEDVWDVYRRYSDFHDLHMTILERVRIHSFKRLTNLSFYFIYLFIFEMIGDSKKILLSYTIYFSV